MKRSDVNEEDKFYTGKASEVVRQLALLGYALIWLFKRDTPAGPTIPIEFQASAFFLTLALLLDFIQYVSGAIGWPLYNKSLYRKSVPVESEVTPPGALYYPTYFAFFAKIAALILGYLCLLDQLYSSRQLFA
jgi:hypothetical protein